MIAEGLNFFGMLGLVFSFFRFLGSDPATAILVGLCAPCLVIGTWLQTVGKYEAEKSDQTGSDDQSSVT